MVFVLIIIDISSSIWTRYTTYLSFEQFSSCHCFQLCCCHLFWYVNTSHLLNNFFQNQQIKAIEENHQKNVILFLLTEIPPPLPFLTPCPRLPFFKLVLPSSPSSLSFLPPPPHSPPLPHSPPSPSSLTSLPSSLSSLLTPLPPSPS